MQFSTLVFSALAATAFAAPVSKRDESSFGLLTIRSGSALQYAGVYNVPSHPHVFSIGGTEGEAVELVLQNDTSLKTTAGASVNIDSATGEVGLTGEGETPATGFSFSGVNLVYDDADAFVACPSGEDKYSLTFNSTCTGGLGISLYVVSSSD